MNSENDNGPGNEMRKGIRGTKDRIDRRAGAPALVAIIATGVAVGLGYVTWRQFGIWRGMDRQPQHIQAIVQRSRTRTVIAYLIKGNAL